MTHDRGQSSHFTHFTQDTLHTTLQHQNNQSNIQATTTTKNRIQSNHHQFITDNRSMVQVTIRVRPKNGYTYVSKIKTVTMESSTRLEELLHRHGEMSAASSHAALYLYGQELPLNSSIASHNLEDGVIIESCKSPNMSAAISAVLRDLDRVKKTIQEGDRKKETLGFLEVPNEYLQDNGEDAIFWQTERWSNDSLKNRTICLAIMKKILQRDDRYSIHDLPSCTDCHSLHQNIQGILPSRNGYLFTPSTKRDGKPSTVWVLLQQKVRRQIEVAASFRKDGGENSSIDTLEEFIRLDTIRHPTISDVTPGTPRRRRRNQPQTPRRENVGHAPPPRTGTPSTPSTRQPYCPQYASGPFAILCTLLEAMEGNHRNSNGRRQLSLTEDSLKHLAQPRCRANFYDRQMMRGSRSAFACMEGLTERNLVRKEITMDRTERWQLLPDGEAMARECLNFERAVNSTIPSHAKFSGERKRDNDNIVLIVDKREDTYFRKRLQTLCADENIETEERELPAGDYLFLQEENVLPVIIERKTWSDLADSVYSKGRAHRRLDCVKIGATSPRCDRGNCQLCKMKRSGCRQVMFIIEGSRCRGRDARRERDTKCSVQKRCQACKALVERHGGNVTQEELEKVLHKLQAHGCFVIFSRSYNETIFSLFTIREILKKGRYYASQIASISEDTSEHDDDLARAITLSLGNSAPGNSNVLPYDQFCSNARSSRTPQLELRKKNGDILKCTSEYLASIIVNEGVEWKQSVGKELFGVIPRKILKRRSDAVHSDRERHIHTPKRRRTENQRKDICIDDDSNSDESIIELNESQDTVDLLACNAEDYDQDVFVLEDSQDSIQILTPIDESTRKAPASLKGDNNCSDDDIVILDDAQNTNEILLYESNTTKDSSLGTNSITAGDVINYDAALERSILLILHGLEDYDEKFNADVNRVWQNCYRNHCTFATTCTRTGTISGNSFSKYKGEIQHLLENQQDRPQFSYLRRKEFISVLLWMQVKHGVNVRTVPPRTAVTTELEHLWTSTDVESSQGSANQIISATIPVSSSSGSSQGSSKRIISATIPASPIVPVNSIQTSAKSAARKPPPNSSSKRAAAHQSPARVKASGPITSSQMSAISAARDPLSRPSSERAARLLRFGGVAENRAQTLRVTNQTSKAKIVRSAPRINSPPTSDNKWSCTKCTFENIVGETVCGACGNERKWICDYCAFHNLGNLKCEFCQKNNSNATDSLNGIPNDSSLPSQKHHLGSLSTPTHARNPVAPISSSSTKRQITCGACTLTGHNRGNATAEICPAYNDEKERTLRETKRRKAYEKAIAKEQEYEESKREVESQQRREADLTRQMDDTRRALERMSELQKADAENKRKNAESARRRANKYR
jgi:ERCC4-type nuclease